MPTDAHNLPAGNRTVRIIGMIAALLFIATAIGVMAVLAQPWRGTAVDAAVGAAVLGFFIILPYLVPLIIQLLVRRPAWVSWLALAYTVVAGAAGVWVYIDVLMDDSSTASIALALFPPMQLAALAVVALIALPVWAARRP
ncbi:hypothetical protein [Brevibacterium moorei]|uniref:hypothetical protein n=1 Tax=Brevibacterium moorei TaxID=2968457 RepID=UPI00211CBAE5|nr:hypothetical protein [Brevibacterium sp. 68QC2CO]MCQ9385597.1 hypothetical protein [Brevibacterium sp. 68QC2CO]